jgi:CheY-like chemotaxis protein
MTATLEMITPNDLRLVVMTVRRSPEYVHTTLASLLLSDALVHQLRGVHLVVGGAEVEYLNHYCHHQRIEIHQMGLEDARRTGHWTLHQRACLNYYRCLTVPPADCRGICICEDDVIFQDGFIEKMLAAVNEMEQTHKLTKYLLNLYLPYGLLPEPSVRCGPCCAKYNAQSFYGTQCLYYPRPVALELAQFVHEHGVSHYRIPGDMLVREYASARNALYGTVRSLVQHIGFTTTGLACFFHRAPTFHGGVPSLNSFSCDAGIQGPQKIRFDLRETLAGTVKILGYQAHKKGLEVIYDVDARVPEVVVGDPFWLQEVVTRLANNAIEFTKAGEVVVRVDIESEAEIDFWLHFSVIDTGDSVPPEAHEMLFEGSIQRDKSIPRKGGTTGPGLLVASSLIGILGGKIWAESGPAQSGNIFHFTVRFGVDKDSPSKPALTPIEELRDLPVLIVDDSESNRRVLLEMLGHLGMKPTAVNGGEAALRIIKERDAAGSAFGLVMLDAEMPGMDGFAVAKRLKEHLDPAGATIMMHSAVLAGDPADRCRQVGSDQLRKPILLSELREALRCFASRASSRQENHGTENQPTI